MATQADLQNNLDAVKAEVQRVAALVSQLESVPPAPVTQEQLDAAVQSSADVLAALQAVK